MNLNTSLVTDTSRAVTDASVDAYTALISQHNDNDWTAHLPIVIAASTFYEQAPAAAQFIPSSAQIRLTLTARVGNADVDTNYVAPALVQGGVFPPIGNAPAILRPPSNVSVTVGQLIELSVYVASATPVTYQWQKNTLDIAGANSVEYIIPSATLADQASYRVVVNNSMGFATSAAATVIVTT